MKGLSAFLMIIGGAALLVAPWIPLDSMVSTKVDDAWILVIEETSERSPVVARIEGDQKFWQSLDGRGLHWRFYDVDSSDADSYRAKAKEVGIPALLIIGKDGSELSAKPLPATTQGIDAEIRRVSRK